jgi:xylan 1,4-beta-xylosidase
MKIPSLLIFSLAALAANAIALDYHNPVRAGDFPDPSVIRVGQDYWATATSSEWAPHFPLLHSRDLVHWELKGPVFTERPGWAKSNFWAPEIAEDKGRFFIYYTARDRESNRLAVAVATAASPGGPYTDHGPLVMEEEGSIDAMPYTDLDGVRWLLWKNDGNSVRKPTPIWLQRLSDDGLKLIGERREILTNDTPWENAVVEGPFVLRHGDYYYLFYSGGACCGRECNYALGVARAKNMTGPWEKAPTNPILATNEAWRCPGHGSIVADPQGRYWLLYHSYAQDGFVATGRQLLLDEVTFGADGWPVINGGRGPSSRARAPAGAGVQADTTVIREDFNGTQLALGWQWMIGSLQTTKLDGGRLTITADNEPAGVAQSIRTPAFVVETTVDGLQVQPETFAGLVVYGDRANGIHFVTNGKSAQVRVYRRQQKTIVADVPIDGGERVGLRIACVGDSRFRFAVQRADGRWQEVGGETDGAHLPPWDRAVRVGLSVTGAKGAQATFDRFLLTPGEPKLLAP